MNINEYVSLIPCQPFGHELQLAGYQCVTNEHPHEPPSDYMIYIDDYHLPIHAYSLFYINDPYQQLLPYPDCFTLAEELRRYYPQPYPYTWFVSYDQAAVVSFNDLYFYSVAEQVPRPGYLFVDNNNNLEEDDQETTEYDGLIKKQIDENLQLTKYYKENKEDEGDACVVCLAEFKRNETLGVLQCKHQYHPRCIKEWLIRQNVCPLCKSQALRVV